MKAKFTGIAVVFISLITGSCGGGQEKASESASKLQYTPEENKVEVIGLKRAPFSHQLISNGRLHAVSHAELTFRATGTVVAVNFSEGERVPKGAVIAAIDSESQRLTLESAQIALRKAELDLFDVLAGQGYSISDTMSVPKEVLAVAKIRSGYDAAVNTVHRARFDYDGCFLKAPFAGKIADLKAERYGRTPNEPACSIIDDSCMEVEFTVLESEYPFLANGQDVRVMPYADQTIYVRGEVKTVNPAVGDKGQVKVTAVVRNDGRLLDGMNVKVIVEKDVPAQLVVPRSAVVIRDNQEVIFVHKDGKARWTYVNVLMSNSESHSVVANEDRGAELHEGDQIIISGNLNLADGSAVTVL